VSEGRRCGAGCQQTEDERGRSGGGSDPRRQGEEGEGGPNGVGVTHGRGGGLGSQQRHGPDGRGGRSGGIGRVHGGKGVQRVGRLLGQSLGPARDEHRHFVIIQKYSNGLY
jgi:hypothetical protein